MEESLAGNTGKHRGAGDLVTVIITIITPVSPKPSSVDQMLALRSL
jgi:hypothetical protein